MWISPQTTENELSTQGLRKFRLSSEGTATVYLVQAVHVVVFHGRGSVCSFLRASVWNCLYGMCEHVCEHVSLWM